ncbi:family 43 glycosylhydrolase [Paenibacillus daejeonensis]|uniref:family 43 glycosylhydrolase n=1 Tax=Paenibacillus daejeonensis TaxID=135193 RepID=UPI00037A16B4|nr:family 43 glycosylhydrolase [Paenibacillus daejeonensis]
MCYTREPLDESVYAPKLACSMHLAYSENGTDYRPLNHNSGVLFAKATENEHGQLQAKSLKNPYLFARPDGTYGVVAVRTEHDGGPDATSSGSVLLFVTSDLLQYEEVGLLKLQDAANIEDVICQYDEAREGYVVRWRDGAGDYYASLVADLSNLEGAEGPDATEAFSIESPKTDIEGVVPRNTLALPQQVAERLTLKLSVPVNVRNEVPSSVAAGAKEELDAVMATAVYSDGTTATKPVDWHTEAVDWSRAGTYRVTGRIRQDHYAFPMASHRADPNIFKWQGRYYFIATNDKNGNKSLGIRVADHMSGLEQAEETVILDTEMHDHLKAFLWAPELHAIGEELYIFHAGSTGEFADIQSHVMKLRSGGDPMVAADWERPVLVVKRDGTPLCKNGITLDMTIILREGRLYVLWAERVLSPHDLGSWIYIAEADLGQPWRLTSDPVLLTRPDYGWANNRTFVDEGPYVILTDKRIFVTFSSALVDATYCVGLLSVDPGADLLDPNNWTKGNYPILTSRSVPGEYGPGHNSYVQDDQGLIWNVYHARPGIEAPRSSGIRRVHFDIDGYPVLDLTEEKDLDPALADVAIEVTVKG